MIRRHSLCLLSSSSAAAVFPAAIASTSSALRYCAAKSPSSSEQPQQQEQQQPKKQQQRSWSWQLPPGLEVYAGCIFLVAGWWYWLEAHYRSIDRRCEAMQSAAAERAGKLNEIVSTTETRWRQDVRGKEGMMLKVQAENVRLAQMLDDVSHYLRKCSPGSSAAV